MRSAYRKAIDQRLQVMTLRRACLAVQKANIIARIVEQKIDLVESLAKCDRLLAQADMLP